VWAGSLREIQVSITGNPDDYVVEVASRAWFGSLAWPGAVGLVIGGPVGLPIMLLRLYLSKDPWNSGKSFWLLLFTFSRLFHIFKV
jgi:hypothetical protein